MPPPFRSFYMGLLAVPAGFFPCIAPAIAGSAGTAPTAMIVFDGSGSVWGNLEGDQRAKFEIAREGLRESLAKLRPDARTGLVAFGHRRRGDCSDVEVIVAPEPGGPERLMAPLDKLNPRGKGPLVGALREAAKAIGTATPASVIVIQDGADNCQQDACQVAAEIAKANPRLAVHVVGIALEPEDAQKMSCVPKATGGTMFEARDAAAVMSTIDQAVKLANLDAASPRSAPAGAEAPPQSPETSAPAVGPPGLRLSAALAPGGAPVTGQVRWRVQQEGVNDAPIREKTSAEFSAPLSPGTYAVEARLGAAAAHQKITVGEKGPTVQRIALNAGKLKVIARDYKDGPLVDVSVTAITHEEGARKGAAVQRPMWVDRASEPEVVLPAGSYRVDVESGLVRREQALTIEPGDVVNLEFTLGAGRIELAAQARDDGPPLELVTFKVFEDDPDSPQGRREVARSAAENPSFTVPAGTYYITASLGDSEVRQRVPVGAGDVVTRTLLLAVAPVKVTATFDHALAPAGLPLVYRAISLEGEPREAGRSSAIDPEFVLAAGRYRLEARLGAQNVEAAEEIVVEAGQPASVALKLDAGAVTLKPAGQAAGALAGDISWEIEDAAGHVVWRTGQSESRALLAPGHYTARSKHRDQRYETSFELQAGEERTVELGGA